MRYVLALICPPLALLACRKWFQAIPAAVLYGLAIVTARYGVGALIEFFLILWAFRAVSDCVANLEARTFTETVKPIPIIRS
jgi:hypothetical protein